MDNEVNKAQLKKKIIPFLFLKKKTLLNTIIEELQLKSSTGTYTETVIGTFTGTENEDH